MIAICPTITVTTREDYTKQLDVATSLSDRIHVDLSDGKFSPVALLPPANIHWPAGVQADLHVMYQDPMQELETLISLNPRSIIVHAEANDYREFIDSLEGLGIRRGVALLAETPTNSIIDLLPKLDQVLIFSGNLGHQGGSVVDLGLLKKVAELRAIHPDIAIGWDGGINSTNAAALVAGGVNALNVGGFIQGSANPREAYEELKTALETSSVAAEG